MKTFKLFTFSLLLSLAGFVYTAGAQSAAQTNDAAKHTCSTATASCCADGAACCRADKADKDGHAGCCADGVCKMRANGAGHHTQGDGRAAAHAAHSGAQHAAHQTAHAEVGAADACPVDNCCAGRKVEGQQAAAHGDCCKMSGDKAHAAHARHQGATAGGGERAHASCCMMHKAGASATQAGDAGSCCASGATCCAANAACCAAARADRP